MQASNTSPTYSFVIPTFNEEFYIEKTISDIQANFGNDDDSFEITVVDNGSTDKTVEIAMSMNCRCLDEPDLGISDLRNAGAKASRGKVLVFIDSDVSLTANWRQRAQPFVPALIAGAKEIVGSHYLPFNQTPWPLRTWFVGGYENPRITFLPGGHTMLSPESFAAIGGFDPSFTTSEDIDFCHRATELDFKIRHQPEIGVIHRGDPQTVRDFLKRECWHGGSDFESLGRVFTSLTSLATLFFVAAHIVAVISAIKGQWLLAAASAISVVGLLIFTSFYLFPKSPFQTKLTNVLNAYLYYVGRCCSTRALFVKSRRS